jgi:hypothetical protein
MIATLSKSDDQCSSSCGSWCGWSSCDEVCRFGDGGGSEIQQNPVGLNGGGDDRADGKIDSRYPIADSKGLKWQSLELDV